MHSNTDPGQKTILLVEDEPIIAVAEQRQLESGGYRVVLAQDGETAVDFIKKDPAIDLVLTDIDLGSGMSGTDAARQMLALRELPIVFLTGHAEHDMVQTVKGITRYGYVLKSSGKFVLLEQVATAFELFDAHVRLAESERRYEFIAGHTSDAVAVYENGKFSYASPSVEQLLGYPAGDYYHETFDSLLEWIHPGDRESLRDTAETVWREHRRSARITFRALRADNTYRVLEGDVTCTYSDDGSLKAMICSFRDITERQTRERLLQADLLGVTNRFNTIADNVPGMVFEFRIAANGRRSFPFASKGAMDFFGLDPHEIESDAGVLVEAIHPDDRKRVEEQIATSQRELSGFEIRNRLVLPDGNVRWISVRSVPRREPDGATIWTGVLVDETARVQAEDQLAEQEKRLRAVFASVGVGILETAADGTILQANSEFTALMDTDVTSLLGKPLKEISHPEDLRWEQEQFGILAETSDSPRLEYRKRFIGSDGRSQWVHVHATRVLGDQQPLRYVFVIRPVQDYRRAGAVVPDAAQQAEPEHYLKAELYRLVQEDPAIFDFLQAGSLDGVWYWDIEHPEQEWMSPRFWEVLGYDPASKRHDPAEWQNIINPDDLKVSLENFAAHVADSSHPYDQVVRYRHRDGSTVWIRCKGIAVRDGNGNAVRMLGTHNEITRLKETELQLREAVAAKSQLMMELHHRVKNNLAMVHSLLSMKDASLSGTVDLSDTIAQVNAILTAHRLMTEDGEHDEVELQSYLHTLLETLFAGAGSSDVCWTLEATPIRVASRPAVRLGMALNELAINAMKHAFGDDNWFTVRLCEQNEMLELRISNGGKDLPESFSLHGNDGLGLSLVRGLIAKLKGTIDYERNPTTFIINIPLRSLGEH